MYKYTYIHSKGKGGEKVANDDYRINVRIPQELRGRFQRLLDERNMVASKLIRSFIEKWVEKKEQEEKSIKK